MTGDGDGSQPPHRPWPLLARGMREKAGMPKFPLPGPGELGTCYLIHLDKPIAHAQHYVGWKLRPDNARLTAHRNGNGGRLLAVANKRGISYQEVRTWPGTDKRWERRLKNYANARLLCPVCNPAGWARLMTDASLPRRTTNRRKRS
jgi:hypothetical protein